MSGVNSLADLWNTEPSKALVAVHRKGHNCLALPPLWIWKAFFLIFFLLFLVSFDLLVLFGDKVWDIPSWTQSSLCSWSWPLASTSWVSELQACTHHAQFTQYWGLNLGLVHTRQSVCQLSHLPGFLLILFKWYNLHNKITILIMFKYTVRRCWAHPCCYVSISTISRPFPTSQTETPYLLHSSSHVPFP